jgi:tRNA-binding protein
VHHSKLTIRLWRHQVSGAAKDLSRCQWWRLRRLILEEDNMSDQTSAATITFDDFMKVDIRAGTVVDAQAYPEARKPAYKLWIDFGPEIGTRKTSAQITEHYQLEDLVGCQVMAVVNFPPRQIGKFMSEVLTLGFHNDQGHVVLAKIDVPVPNGARLN